jgi:hypothetical protein
MLLRFLTSATRVRVFLSRNCAELRDRFSACQTSGTSRSELANWERTCQMITLTRDLNVFTSCITTGLSAVFFSIRHIAQARNMCALFDPLIGLGHFVFFLLSGFLQSVEHLIVDGAPLSWTS